MASDARQTPEGSVIRLCICVGFGISLALPGTTATGKYKDAAIAGSESANLIESDEFANEN